jgi:hypothetical protein
MNTKAETYNLLAARTFGFLEKICRPEFLSKHITSSRNLIGWSITMQYSFRINCEIASIKEPASLEDS